MIIDFINIPMRLPTGVELDTSCIGFQREPYGMEDTICYGRSLLTKPLYKYKIIEQFNDRITERIVLTIQPLDQSNEQDNTITLYPVSLKIYPLPPTTPIKFFRFPKAIIPILQYLSNKPISRHQTFARQVLKLLMRMLHTERDPYNRTEIVKFLRNHRAIIDGVVDETTPYHWGTMDVEDTAAWLCGTIDPYTNNSKDQLRALLSQITPALPTASDPLTRRCLRGETLTQSMLKNYRHPTFGLFRAMQLTDQPYPGDDTCIYNDINISYNLYELINFLETMPYTDVSLHYSNGQTEVKYAASRYLPETYLDEQTLAADHIPMYTPDAHPILFRITELLLAWLSELGPHKPIKALLLKTWAEELFIDVEFEQGIVKTYYFDLILTGLGSHALRLTK